MQSIHKQQIKQLREEFDKERTTLASLQLRNQEEQKLNRSFQEEQNSLKADKENVSKDSEKKSLMILIEKWSALKAQ
ncbi:hypothetical protein Tco_1414191 [Tanacetum coccineum]